jgi:hypothetical protein
VVLRGTCPDMSRAFHASPFGLSLTTVKKSGVVCHEEKSLRIIFTFGYLVADVGHGIRRMWHGRRTSLAGCGAKGASESAVRCEHAAEVWDRIVAGEKARDPSTATSPESLTMLKNVTVSSCKNDGWSDKLIRACRARAPRTRCGTACITG